MRGPLCSLLLGAPAFSAAIASPEALTAVPPATTSAIAPLDASRGAFDAWCAAHGRSWVAGSAEAERRFAFFRANAAAAAAVAARAAPLAQYDLRGFAFADWSAAEFAAQRPPRPDRWGAASNAADAAPAEEQRPFSDAAVARARAAGPIDWVSRGAVTPPISQGRCGTCAQFSATADIEGQWFLAGHPLVPLAVQEMVDCASYTGPYGMGWVADVHKGLARAEDYPLANHSDPTLAGCRANCSAPGAAKSFARIDGATCAGSGIYDNETQMLAWLQHGPLSVSVAAGPFNAYAGGIIAGGACNTTAVDHAVLLVGYGEENGTAYWTLKNSWGPAFGEGGYVRIEHGVSCLGLRGACQAYIGAPPSSSS
jgi:cathepsin F